MWIIVTIYAIAMVALAVLLWPDVKRLSKLKPGERDPWDLEESNHD